MNTLNGTKSHLARKTDSSYAVCRRSPIRGAMSLEEWQAKVDRMGEDHETFCKTCARKFKELT
jgi:hypothetical protein